MTPAPDELSRRFIAAQTDSRPRPAFGPHTPAHTLSSWWLVGAGAVVVALALWGLGHG